MTQRRSDDDSAGSERRKDDRTTAVYRPVLIETDDFTGFCLLKNLSSSGLMGVAYANFAAEQSITVQFVPGHVVPGRIVWSSEGKIGVEFDKEIDLFDSLQGMGSQYVNTRVNRSPRLVIDCEGELQAGEHTIGMRLLDISQRGLKASVSSLRPGEEVTVRLPGMQPRKALVRWSKVDVAGLNFVRPIGFEELARWAIGQQADPEAEELRYG